MKTKKILSFLLTCAMLCSLVLSTGVTAGAADALTDTFSSFYNDEEGHTHTGAYGELVTAYECNGYIALGCANAGIERSCPITAKDGYYISKVELTVGMGENFMEGIKASSGTESVNRDMITGNTITISDVNAKSVNFGSSTECVYVRSVVVTYMEAKTAQTLTFDGVTDGAVSKTYGDTAFTETVTGAATTVTYGSSDENVATVDSNGKVTILKAGSTTITATAAEAVPYAKGEASYTLTVTEKPSCSHVVDKDLKAGEQILALDGVAVGTYTLAESGDGWTVQDADGKYLTFNETDKTVSWTETPTVWSYNGGLYVPVQETQSWHWWWKFVGESDYYLTLDEGRLVTTLAYTFATVQETEVFDAHDYIYINNQDGTHDALCLNCGEKIEGEAHTYVEGKCICGAFDPTNLTVNATVTSTQKKIFGWRTKTVYKAEIETSVPDVSIQSRTTEDGAWNYGPVYTSSSPIDALYVQVTDSNGDVTNWKYADGMTTKAE